MTTTTHRTFEFIDCDRCERRLGIAMGHQLEVICIDCLDISDTDDVERYAQATRVA